MKNVFAIRQFLSNLKAALAADNVVFEPRNRKTTEFLLNNDLTEEDVFIVLEKLEEKHHHDGPLKDRNKTPGNVMMFLYWYEGIKLYIKIKTWTESGTGATGVVISFHEEGMHNDRI